MNKKGQVLVTFVILIPIIIIFLGFIIDIGINLNTEKRVVSTLNNIMSYSLQNKEIISESLIESNVKANLNYDNLVVSLTDETLTISIDVKTKSVFSKVFKSSIKKIEVELVADLKTDKIIRKDVI